MIPTGTIAGVLIYRLVIGTKLEAAYLIGRFSRRLLGVKPTKPAESRHSGSDDRNLPKSGRAERRVGMAGRSQKATFASISCRHQRPHHSCVNAKFLCQREERTTSLEITTLSSRFLSPPCLPLVRRQRRPPDSSQSRLARAYPPVGLSAISHKRKLVAIDSSDLAYSLEGSTCAAMRS